MKVNIIDNIRRTVEINNNIITKDFIILSNGIIWENWRRENGHYLTIDDFKYEHLNYEPHELVVGIGTLGRLEIDPKLIEELNIKNIKVVPLKTDEALEYFNSKIGGSKLILGTFHLTC